ncbi:MAG: site-2 protease family protein [Candidatus Gracilibacteria bacterium]|jgi:regulator of sigma E protease
MTIFLTVLVFLLVFSALILVHELGHFFAAKRAGVQVEEFGFGLPPRLFGVKKGETLYSLNAIPFGGFVRMLGEDESTEASRKSKRSFSNQPLRTQAWIVVAGVVMNFLLAFVFLTIGFWIGIEPLISTEDDFYNGIREGTVNIEPGLTEGLEEEGVYLPRLVYLAQEGTVFSDKLENGDVIILVNGEEVLTEDDFFATIEGKNSMELEVYREGTGIFPVVISLPEMHPIISFIEPESPAELAGLQVQDQILRLEGEPVYTAEQILGQMPLLAGEDLITYTILRSGEEQELIFEIAPRPEDGRVGIGISDLIPNTGNLSLYQTYVPHTLVGFEKIQYGWAAPWVAFNEMGRLAKLTAVSFVGVIQQFITGGGVSAGVSGPVGIAQMTFVTLQDGFAAMLRFIALLSLSLGVINILPIPALDGGKFFFILVRGITGKKFNPKYEQLIHAAGFLFLIVLILAITFNDIMNLF